MARVARLHGIMRVCVERRLWGNSAGRVLHLTFSPPPPPPARRLPPAVHPRAAAGAGGRDLRVKTRTVSCIQLDQDELDLR